MNSRSLIVMAVMLALPGCGGAGGSGKQWDDLDYSGIAASRGENDSGYTMPVGNSGGNCLEDICQ